MCFTVAIIRKNTLEIASRYYDSLPAVKEKPPRGQELPLYYFVSGFSHPQLPIVKHDAIDIFEWGLIPVWVKDVQTADEIRSKTLNAVGETVFEKPSFRKSIATQRCLLPVDGFYEWRDVNGMKYPYFVHATDNDLFSLGCIYETWVDKKTGVIRNTFSILTTPANPLMEKIHNLKKRMPLIIPPRHENEWVDPLLNTEQITALIKPFPESGLTAYTISRLANNARNNRNTPEILKKVEYGELF